MRHLALSAAFLLVLATTPAGAAAPVAVPPPAACDDPGTIPALSGQTYAGTAVWGGPEGKERELIIRFEADGSAVPISKGVTGPAGTWTRVCRRVTIQLRGPRLDGIIAGDAIAGTMEAARGPTGRFELRRQE
jgi:hypothetical protein